ncbi:winged helix-turn-helix domain-containing protein [Desulfopila sp. IMCC35008]|uniref:winged helix-turn-helix domain-containing protein n=1 Tax=Desulfopila sp. IMCC35008 TaxID=2653858 RepID=UPI0013D309F4|nr:winged helix-turn-helix domain-containing protein [Desulfopila sp. IMCC35008]
MMDQMTSTLPFAIPSNKFYPPHIDPSQSLLREDLLSQKLPQQITAKKAIIVEAQAGQGKTTLISQFLDHNGFCYLWYQVGPEDSDPVMLLSSLLANFTLKYPEFSSPQLATILSEGSVGPLDLQTCANILLGDINNFLDHDLYIVFDDLHLISGAMLTKNLLEYLLDTSPPRLHFVLSSRHPLEMKCKTLRDANRISYLNTSDLALSDIEIEDLFNSVLNTSITRKDAMDIYRVTNGWIMGIVLASHPMSGRARFWQQSNLDELQQSPDSQGHMLDYFQDEIFDKIPESLHNAFLKLAFIGEIPVDLATKLTGIENFDTILSEMARENFFVYHLDDSKSVFRFHHFFQEFLQLRAQQTLNQEEINQIYTDEAEYYLAKNMLEKALASYKHGGDYLTMERLLREQGMELIAKNRTLTILALLDSLPEDILFQHSWLTLYAGLLRNDFTPQVTLPYYEKAKEIFIVDGDETGELLCLSQMIYFHFVISGLYNIGATLLPRTAELLKKNKETLPDHVQIIAARNLASGYCFFTSDMERARSSINLASILATRQNSKNFIASVSFIKGYIELFSGNQARYLREAETCYELLNDPLVGMSNKLTIRIMYLAYLSMTGDFLNFKIHQQALQESIDERVVEQTVAAPYMYVWGAICYLSMGQTETGMELLNKGFGITSTASTSHMHSQILQWMAFGSAIQGDTEHSLELIAESGENRQKAGGPFYIAFHHIMAGGVYTRAGEPESALKAINEGLRVAESIPSTFLSMCGYFNRAYYRLLTDGPEDSLDDLDKGLSLMKNNGYTHFWGWEPKMMMQLLTTAIRFDIEKSFSQALCRARLIHNIDDEGTLLPLLNFTLLDRFQLQLGESVVCRAKDLTPSQRELLGLLITAKGQRISQERIQLELWPDNSPENARKSFDTLLTRLRKELTKNSELPVKQYIFMQKGILCLDNYQMDALQFSEAARKGMVHAKNDDWWQAGNAFHQALYHWKGVLPEDTFKNEQVLTYNDQLVNILIEFTKIWAKHVAASGRTDEAIKLIERALGVTSLEEQLITLLYGLHLKNNNPLKASETLERYKTALLKIEYSEEEVEDYLRDVVHTAQEIVRNLGSVSIL